MRNGSSHACVAWHGLHQRTECSIEQWGQGGRQVALDRRTSDDVALVTGDRGQRLEHRHAGLAQRLAGVEDPLGGVGVVNGEVAIAIARASARR